MCELSCFSHALNGEVKGSFKVLTLGISGSGKSTFAKQLRIINDAMSTDEIDVYKIIIFKNLMLGMQELVRFAEKLEYPISSENRKHGRFFTELSVFETEWDDKIAKKINLLWSDEAIQKTWKEIPLHQFQVPQLDYLMNSLDRYLSPDFTPTNDDILCARQRTTGSQTTTFITERYQWNLIDVGGQKPEREKWLQVIREGVDCLIFFAALDEFNMESIEDHNKTKMDVSVEVFKEIMHCKEISQTCCLLFLNKVDLLQRKLQHSDSAKEFLLKFPKTKIKDQITSSQSSHSHSSRTATSLDLNSCVDQVKELFLKQLEDPDCLYVHTTCALDTKAMNVVFEAVKDSIWKTRMEQAVEKHNF